MRNIVQRLESYRYNMLFSILPCPLTKVTAGLSSYSTTVKNEVQSAPTEQGITLQS